MFFLRVKSREIKPKEQKYHTEYHFVVIDIYSSTFKQFVNSGCLITSLPPWRFRIHGSWLSFRTLPHQW